MIKSRRTWWGERNIGLHMLVVKNERIYHLENVVEGGRKILKLVLKKWGVMWTGFTWYKLGSSDVLL
jgi:hypothetical protein